MEPLTLPYELCSRYVRDESTTLADAGCLNLIQGWIRSRQLEKLAACTSLIPEALSTRDLFRVLMQIEAFFKKNSVYKSDSAKAVAITTFHRGERICRITNRRLDHYCTQQDRLDPDLRLWLSKAESYIRRTLGPFDEFLGILPELVRVTAGATSTRSRREALPHLKVRKRPYAVPSAEPYLNALSQYWGYGRVKVRPTVFNRVETVPKSWKTDRTIACEPEGLIPLQLAFDTYAKRRLRLRGIDLADQGQNQRKAYEASICDGDATIDLSMASDTLAYNTVAALLPEEWFQYLCAVRSPCFKDETGSARTYAKFSSMGNGATFSLETLIFAGACYAVGSKSFSVYGDDIIIEQDRVESLLRFMRFLGFHVNQDKSHVSGPFRESCGMNAYEGVDITPFYLRDVGRRKAYWCHIINGLASICTPGGELEAYLLDWIQEANLPLVPFNGNSLSGIWVDIPTAYSEKVLTVRHGITRFKAYKAKSRRKLYRSSQTLFLWYLYSQDKGEFASLLQRMEAAFEPERLPSNEGSVRTSVVGKRERLRTTSVPIPSHKYVRKWVHWFPPVAGTPVHLYRWTDQVIRRKAD